VLFGALLVYCYNKLVLFSECSYTNTLEIVLEHIYKNNHEQLKHATVFWRVATILNHFEKYFIDRLKLKYNMF